MTWPGGRGARLTAIDNLVLVCSPRHHHRQHTAGWSATLAPDGTSC